MRWTIAALSAAAAFALAGCGGRGDAGARATLRETSERLAAIAPERLHLDMTVDGRPYATRAADRPLFAQAETLLRSGRVRLDRWAEHPVLTREGGLDHVHAAFDVQSALRELAPREAQLGSLVTSSTLDVWRDHRTGRPRRLRLDLEAGLPGAGSLLGRRLGAHVVAQVRVADRRG